MKSVAILQDLFDHNDWANRRVLSVAAELSDEQLDQPREMGFGTLRNTLFHVLEAEKLWLERWQAKPWRALQADAEGKSVADIQAESTRTAEVRNAMIEEESNTGFSRVVEFQDSQGNSYKRPIGSLMSHVANHGIHHRAQALGYLKGFGKKVPGGLDYIFHKMAYPSAELPEESLAKLRKYGLEAATDEGAAPALEKNRLRAYFEYADWAMKRVFDESSVLSDKHLDQPIDLGTGTLRKNLRHILDAERWWVANWAQDRSPFLRDEEPSSLADIRQCYEQTSVARKGVVAALDETSAQRIIYIEAGGPSTCFLVLESMLQLCCHGTHHRSQCVNMLRQLGITFSWIDYIVWVPENSGK